MAEVRHEVTLNALPGRVWEFITTIRHLPLWLDGIASVQAISDPQTSAGTTFTAVRRGHYDDEAWLVAEWEPPHRLRLIEYRRKQEILVLLSETREGARLNMRYIWPREWGLLDRILPPRAQRQMIERALAKLKEIVCLNQDIKLLHGMGDE